MVTMWLSCRFPSWVKAALISRIPSKGSWWAQARWEGKRTTRRFRKSAEKARKSCAFFQPTDSKSESSSVVYW